MELTMTTRTMRAVRQHEFGGPEVLRYEDAPLPELKAGSPPSDRQRGAAGRQMAVWVAARECLNGGEYDRIGERLGERALAAARLQEELAEPITILKEWGELALARERP